MQVTSSSSSGDNADELRQALMLKKAIKADSDEQLALINSASTTSSGDSPESRTVGRWLNEKA